MFDALQRLVNELAAIAAELDPDLVPAQSVVAMYELLDLAERHAATAKTLLVRRVDDVQQWRRSGYATAAEYLAAKSGSTVGAAKSALATSTKLVSLPVLRDAMRAGTLSASQATVITDAAATAPSQQSRLVDEAQRSSFKELRDACLHAKAAADRDREVTNRRIHSERYVRTWTDAEGAWNFHARGTPADGARVESKLRALVDEEFASARTEGRRDALDAYAFDAFIRLSEGASAADRRPTLRNLMLLRVDLEALRRGEARDGEFCEITGIGPIPVSTARELLGESVLKLVITKGEDVLHVTHLGRRPTVAQQIALLFRQTVCSVEGCARTRTELDHRETWADTRRTPTEGLDPLCKHHHDLKTYDGWSLVAGTGKRSMVPPESRFRADEDSATIRDGTKALR